MYGRIDDVASGVQMSKNFFGFEEKEEESVEEYKRQKTNVFDYVKSINLKDKYLGDKLEDYSAFIVNKAMSGYVDCIMYAKEINLYSNLSSRMNYDFYYHSIKKSKRYAEWYKNNDETIQNIVDYFNISRTKATEVLDILTEEDLKKIKKSLTYGITEK